jgi:hypothetical protein
MYVCMCVCMYVCVYVYIYIYIYIYINIQMYLQSFSLRYSTILAHFGKYPPERELSLINLIVMLRIHLLMINIILLNSQI